VHIMILLVDCELSSQKVHTLRKIPQSTQPVRGYQKEMNEQAYSY
jgi:hypothetical protein